MDMSTYERTRLTSVFKNFGAQVLETVPLAEQDIAARACAVLRRYDAFSRLEPAITDIENAINDTVEHLQDEHSVETSSRIEQLASIMVTVGGGEYDLESDPEGIADEYFRYQGLFERNGDELLFCGSTDQLDLIDTTGSYSCWELLRDGIGYLEEQGRHCKNTPDPVYYAVFALWILDAAIDHREQGNLLVLRRDVRGEPCHTTQGSRQHWEHLARANELVLDASQAVNQAELLLSNGNEQRLVNEARTKLARIGGRARSQIFEPVVEKAYELARARVPGRGQWPSRRNAVHSIKDDVLAFAKLNGVAMSAPQAEKTIDGWLRNMPDANTLFAGKRRTSA